MFSRLAGVSAGAWALPAAPATASSEPTASSAAGNRRPIMATPVEQFLVRPVRSLARRQQDPGGNEAVPGRRALRLLAGWGAALLLRQVRVLRLVADAIAVVVDLLVLGRQLLGA